MVLAVQKHLKMAIITILNNPEQPLLMQFFQKNSLLEEVLASVLHLGGVFSAGLLPDGPGCPETP